jgi:hypothetical protein
MSNAAEINSDQYLCHGPEDGEEDQPLVGEVTEGKGGNHFPYVI